MPVTSESSSSQPKTRLRYARGEGDRLRIDLLDAAAELLALHGNIDAVSLRAVAAAAGVSPTAVYRHFEDHADLMSSAVDYCWSEFQRALLVEPADDPFTSFERMGRAYTQFAVHERGKYQVIFALMHELDGSVNELGFATFAMLVDAVAAMLTVNNDARDPFLVATLVHSWMHGIVGLCGNKPSDDNPWPSVDELMIELKNYLWLNPAPTP